MYTELTKNRNKNSNESHGHNFNCLLFKTIIKWRAEQSHGDEIKYN